MKGEAFPSCDDATNRFRYIDPHELFNKINNSELLVPLHFVEEGVGQATAFCSLKDSHVLPYPHITDSKVESIFPRERLFPFLSKCESFTENQRKLPRQYVLLFSQTEDHTAVHLTISKFANFIDSLGGRIHFEDFVCDDREGYNAAEEVQKEFLFTVRLLVLRDWYDHFLLRYDKCNLFTSSTHTHKWKSTYYATEILPGFLFLGDYLNGGESAQLAALGITHLVDATGHEQSRSVCESLGIAYLAVNIWDVESADIRAHFPAAEEFIATAAATSAPPHRPHRVLVHCRAGWSRSTSLVLAYLMRAQRMRLADALAYTVRMRPMVCPNDAFRQQLCAYEEELFGARSVADEHAALAVLRKYGVLWSDQSAERIESDFDRIPIRAFKKNMAATEYEVPAEEAGGAGEGAGKPKKPFLRRGQGKTILAAKKTTAQEDQPAC